MKSSSSPRTVRAIRDLAWLAWFAMVVASNNAFAQLVAGSARLFVVDLASGADPRNLLSRSGISGLTRGIAADNTSRTLYWLEVGATPSTQLLYRAAFTTSGDLIGQLVGTVRVAGANVVMNGLAFDSAANQLIAYRDSGDAATEGFYSVNTSTGVCTLISTIDVGVNFSGFDYNPLDDSFYATNDENAPPLGRGLWRIQKPLTLPTITFVTPYPGTDTDVDGLAIGNGRAYLINENSPFYVYNLAASTYEADIPLPTEWRNGTESGGAWAPALVNLGPLVAFGTSSLSGSLSGTATNRQNGGSISLAPSPKAARLSAEGVNWQFERALVDPVSQQQVAIARYVLRASITGVSATESIGFIDILATATFLDPANWRGSISGAVTLPTEISLRNISAGRTAYSMRGTGGFAAIDDTVGVVAPSGSISIPIASLGNWTASDSATQQTRAGRVEFRFTEAETPRFEFPGSNFLGNAGGCGTLQVPCPHFLYQPL